MVRGDTNHGLKKKLFLKKKYFIKMVRGDTLRLVVIIF